MSNILVHIDKAKREILAADSLIKVKDLWNKAEGARQLGQAARDPELITYATEFKLRCERRLGEFLEAMKARGEIREGRPPKNYDGVDIVSLEELQIGPHLSSRAQQIASVPEEKFEAVIAEAKQGEKELTRQAVARLLQGAHVGQNTGEAEWYTPEPILKAAREVLEEIDLDPASHADAQTIIQARQFFTADMNGLSQPWHGRVWLNPPYSQPLVQFFCDKLLSEYEGGRVVAAISLTNNATETQWGQTLLNGASAVCFHAGRVGFWAPGRETSTPLQGQMLCYFGVRVERFTKEFSRFGVVFPRS